MNRYYLFPYQWKLVGWIIFVPAFLAGLFWLVKKPEPEWLDWKVFALFTDDFGSKFTPEGEQSSPSFRWIDNNVLDEILGVLLIIGGTLVAFSREKIEDEFISKLRLDSLVWATYVNYGLLLLALLLVYDLAFFNVMIINMFTLLLFFIARFHWYLLKNRQSVAHAE